MECASMKSIHHLQSYPMVNDSYQLVSTYYRWAKQRYSVVNYTCGIAETGVSSVVQPLLHHFQTQVESLDKMADAQLNRVEEYFPVVKKPTQEVIAAVTPTTPILHSYEAVSKKVKDSETYVKQWVNSGYQLVETAISTADHYVDVYLPDDEENVQKSHELTNMADDASGEASPVKSSPSAQDVLRKTRSRVYRRSRKNYLILQERTITLLHQIGLLPYLRFTGDQVLHFGSEFWQWLNNVTVGVLSAASSDKATGSHRLDKLTTHYVNSVIQLLGQLSTFVSAHIKWQKPYNTLASIPKPDILTETQLTGLKQMCQQAVENVTTAIAPKISQFPENPEVVFEEFPTSEEPEVEESSE